MAQCYSQNTFVYQWRAKSPGGLISKKISNLLPSFFFFSFLDRVSLWSPDCPGTLYVAQAGLKLQDPSTSTSPVWELKACATMPSHHSQLIRHAVQLHKRESQHWAKAPWLCVLWPECSKSPEEMKSCMMYYWWAGLKCWRNIHTPKNGGSSLRSFLPWTPKLFAWTRGTDPNTQCIISQ